MWHEDVVGDRAGGVYAFHLSNGSSVAGWPAHLGAPLDSTPSAAPNGAGTDTVFVSDAGFFGSMPQLFVAASAGVD